MKTLLAWALLLYIAALSSVVANLLAARLRRRGWRPAPTALLSTVAASAGPALYGLTLGLNGVHFLGGSP